MTTATAALAATTDVTVVVTRHGDYVAHLTGCNHTSRRDLQDAFPPVPVANRYEAACSIYDNGIMDENEDHAYDDVAYWETALDFAPCLKGLASALDAPVEIEAAPAADEVTAAVAAQELARRAHNRAAKRDADLERREPTSSAAFALSAAELRELAG